MTCYSNKEEKVNELFWWDKVEPKAEDMLRKAGAIMVEHFPLSSKVTVDRELITAQGPPSAGALGEELVKALQRARPATA
jgi:putative intracellular protease/amidase